MPQHQGDAALADLDALVLRLEARGADEPAGPDDEGLVQHDEAAHERPLGGAVPVDGAVVEALLGPDDPAIGMTERDGDGSRGRAS